MKIANNCNTIPTLLLGFLWIVLGIANCTDAKVWLGVIELVAGVGNTFAFFASAIYHKRNPED